MPTPTSWWKHEYYVPSFPMISPFDLKALLENAQRSLLNHRDLLVGAAAASLGSALALRHAYYKYIRDKVIFNEPIPFKDFQPQSQFDKLRHDTYPSSYLNAWYHLCDSDQLKVGQMLEFHVVGQTLILWRKSDGEVVCQDAYCPHAGANLASGGGNIKNDRIVCPFHEWAINSDGTIGEIPYIKNPSECPKSRRLKTYRCIEYCKQIYFWFHADNGPPLYPLPDFVSQELTKDNWVPHMKWDVGYKKCTAVDWIDQAGDHAHFFFVHKDFMVPFTLIQFPEWLKRLVPLGITHQLTTYKGNDSEWIKELESDPERRGSVDPHYIFFKDRAGLTWNGNGIESTFSNTFETYVGPALIVFHIPFTIGALKAFVTYTPVEGGCIMRVRTWIDERTSRSWFKRFVAWLLVGISTSNLANDLTVLERKARYKKPLVQPFDGPFNRVNAWMKQFVSPSTQNVGEKLCCSDW